MICYPARLRGEMRAVEAEVVERYIDLITNGLDLVSFVLVTPEITKTVWPTVAGVATSLIVVGGTLLPMVYFIKISGNWLLANLPAWASHPILYIFAVVLIIFAEYNTKGKVLSRKSLLFLFTAWEI